MINLPLCAHSIGISPYRYPLTPSHIQNILGFLSLGTGSGVIASAENDPYIFYKNIHFNL